MKARIVALAVLVSLFFVAQPALVVCATAASPSGPAIRITQPAEGAVLTGRYTFAGEAPEGSVVSISFWESGHWHELGEQTSWSMNALSWSFKNGPATLRARAVDAEGVTHLATVNVTIATLPNELTMELPAEGEAIQGDLDFRGIATNPNCGDNYCWAGWVEVSFHGDEDWGWYSAETDPSGRWNATFRSIFFRNGPFTLMARVHVDQGPVTVVTRNVTIANPPTAESPARVVIIEPAEGATVSGVIDVRGEIENTGIAWNPREVSWTSDVGNTWHRAQGVAPWNFTWDTRSGPNGATRLWVRYLDGGLVTLRSITLVVENDISELPSVALVQRDLGERPRGAEVVVEGVSAARPPREVVAVEGSLDGGPWQRAEGTERWRLAFDTSTLNEGRHTVAARSFDGFAFSSTELASFTTTARPLSGPHVNITRIDASEAGVLTIEVDAVDHAGTITNVDVFVDGRGPWPARRDDVWRIRLGIALDPGEHVVSVRVGDGTTWSPTLDRNFTIAATPAEPIVPSDEPANAPSPITVAPGAEGAESAHAQDAQDTIAVGSATTGGLPQGEPERTAAPASIERASADSSSTTAPACADERAASSVAASPGATLPSDLPRARRRNARAGGKRTRRTRVGSSP